MAVQIRSPLLRPWLTREWLLVVVQANAGSNPAGRLTLPVLAFWHPTKETLMANLMMLSRELMRVPLDFDAPVGKTWQPRLEHPDWHDFPACPVCGPPAIALGHNYGGGGDGLTPEARAISEMIYALGVPNSISDHVRVDRNLGEKEVALMASWGQFKEFVPCPKGCERGGKVDEDCDCNNGMIWRDISPPPTAAEVNEVNRNGAPMFHPLSVFGGLATHAILKARCELLGIAQECATCEGHGDIATAEKREEREEWTMPDPPEGPGYQLWESVSEGGPVSPVFETIEALASWLVDHETVASNSYDFDGWMKVLKAEVYAFEIGSGQLV